MDRRLIIGGFVVLALGALLFGVLSSDGDRGTDSASSVLRDGDGSGTGSGTDEGSTEGVGAPIAHAEEADGGVPRQDVQPTASIAEITQNPANPANPTEIVADPAGGLARRTDEPFISNGYEVGRIQSRRQELERRITRVRERVAALDSRGDPDVVARQQAVLTRLETGLPPLLEREEAYRTRAEADGTTGDIARGLEETERALQSRQALSQIPSAQRRQ